MGTIYYWSPDYTSAVGGVKILYRHVDILNKNGFNASVIHRKSGFRCTWFYNDTEEAMRAEKDSNKDGRVDTWYF